MDCTNCRSISGEQRISPGSTIHAGRYWQIEHAYPCHMVGWLVLVLKRHVEALHELTPQEFAERGELQAATVRNLRAELHCAKEYLVCFAEAEHFQHIHVHVIARRADLPSDLKGTRIFEMIKVSPVEAVPPQEIKTFCENLRSNYTWNSNFA